MAPKFVIALNKCAKCGDTVYHAEQTDYDGKIYHTACFRCLSCNRVITAHQVAQLNGDIYDKTCFKKIFLREGKYTTFTNTHNNNNNNNNTNKQQLSATQPIIDNISTQKLFNEGNGNNESDAGGSVSGSNIANTNTITTPSNIGTVNSRLATFEQRNQTVPGKSSKSSATPYQHPLLNAIARNDMDTIDECINTNGVIVLLQLIVQADVQITPIEFAFTLNDSKQRDTARVLLDKIRTSLDALQSVESTQSLHNTQSISPEATQSEQPVDVTI